ncbi:S-adenosyl-L-methionine-dependent methyltransferase [Zopfia rhizophila CBS 207.26]|uniref:S-adenosyl-L-methionine-dependent methyltransferase n=1 Tax=Zopfia rhizophila CBS 207.26 TaxID=1314779 RepID=A0A6A6E3M8_9PEZI|nr:S-adenosyl-L-methionine-dependent methyltransferase [Zopfia rhizophila CBS 207.26]
MSRLTPSQLLTEVEALASNPSEDLASEPELRAKLYRACRAASTSLEQPTELVVRELLSQPVESTLVNIALDLELFAKLTEEGGNPKSLSSLAESTKTDHTLLKRLLRALAAFGAVKEVEGEKYILSPAYSILADAAFGHAVVNCANFLNPTYQALPSLLKSINYQTPTDPKNTAAQRAFGYTDTDLMGILAEKPTAAQGFGMLMSTWGEGHALLQHLYPVQAELVEKFDPQSSDVIFVDVGGGYGQKAIALKEAFPDLPGRIIVQDLPMSIERAPKVEGIEFMVHDFFTEQPIKDEACVKILSHLRHAMAPGYSKLLIHEQITPEIGASVWNSIQDINMMALCGVAERTEDVWRKLLQQAGLRVNSVYQAKDGVSEGVIAAEAEA